MKVLDAKTKEQLSSVPAKWREMWFQENDWHILNFGQEVNTGEIYNQLVAIKDLSENDITRILGDNNFARSLITRLYCSECHNRYEKLMVFDEEDRTALCSNCLERALRELKENEPTT